MAVVGIRTAGEVLRHKVSHTDCDCKNEHSAREESSKPIFCEAVREGRTHDHSTKRKEKKSQEESPVEADETQLTDNTGRGVQGNHWKRGPDCHSRVEAGKQDKRWNNKETATDAEESGQQAYGKADR